MDTRQKKLVSLLVLAFFGLSIGFYLRTGPLSEKIDSSDDGRREQLLPVMEVLNIEGSSSPLTAFLSGSDFTLISLWATWCAPCIKELPLLEKRQQAFSKEGIHVLLLNYDNGTSEAFGRKEVSRWLEKTGVHLQTIFDPKEQLLEALEVHALPYNVLVSKSGRILYAKYGVFDEKKIIKTTKSFLAKKQMSEL